MVIETKRLLELDELIEKLNQKIALLQARRDIDIFEAIKEGGFRDYPEFNYWSITRSHNLPLMKP